MKRKYIKERVTIKYRDPNPLFKQWLSEWLKYSEDNNLGNKHALARALNSLEKYPLPLASAQDCTILEGFGPTICQMLEKKLEKQKVNLPEKISKKPQAPEEIVEKIAKKKTRTVKSPAKKKAQRKTPLAELDEMQDNNVIIMSSNTFEIILLVDTQETKGKSKKSIDATIKELNASKVTYEIRHLNVGDFAWIARDFNDKELILPYIVERKRLDDFGKSIRDGRFHEQKFRLMQCGLPNVIYMVEMYESKHLGLPFKTILQAATNTNVHNRFTVKITDNHHGSILYLSCLTQLLKKIFQEKVLVGCSKDDLKDFNLNDEFVSLMNFREFNSASSKTKEIKVRDFFVRQLMKVSSLSVEKALAITRIYGTPKLLMNAYESCLDENEKRSLLANIKYGKNPRQIGQKLSEVLYEFFHKTIATYMTKQYFF
ncbi:mus81 [Sergentomyia squamirostris]